MKTKSQRLADYEQKYIQRYNQDKAAAQKSGKPFTEMSQSELAQAAKNYAERMDAQTHTKFFPGISDEEWNK